MMQTPLSPTKLSCFCHGCQIDEQTGDYGHMKQLVRALLTSCLVVSVSACAPEFGLKLEAPSVPDATDVPEGGADASASRIRVGAFSDSRASSTIVIIDGREVASEGSIGDRVRNGFERYFRDSGVRVVLKDAPIIDGEVVEWRSTITPGFPASDAVATAKLKVTLKDSHFHVLYRGTFTGEATVTHPLLDEEHVQELLGLAMGGAIEAAVGDQAIRSQLMRGRIE